jgi:hypothetical protein
VPGCPSFAPAAQTAASKNIGLRPRDCSKAFYECSIDRDNYLLPAKSAQHILRRMPHRLPHSNAAPYSFTAPVIAGT